MNGLCKHSVSVLRSQIKKHCVQLKHVDTRPHSGASALLLTTVMRSRKAKFAWRPPYVIAVEQEDSETRGAAIMTPARIIEADGSTERMQCWQPSDLSDKRASILVTWHPCLRRLASESEIASTIGICFRCCRFSCCCKRCSDSLQQTRHGSRSGLGRRSQMHEKRLSSVQTNVRYLTRSFFWRILIYYWINWLSVFLQASKWYHSIFTWLLCPCLVIRNGSNTRGKLKFSFAFLFFQAEVTLILASI